MSECLAVICTSNGNFYLLICIIIILYVYKHITVQYTNIHIYAYVYVLHYLFVRVTRSVTSLLCYRWRHPSLVQGRARGCLCIYTGEAGVDVVGSVVCLSGARLGEGRDLWRRSVGMSAQRKIICQGELLKRCRVSCRCARRSGCVTQAQKLQHQLHMGTVELGETDFGAATTHYIIVVPFGGGLGCFECS